MNPVIKPNSTPSQDMRTLGKEPEKKASNSNSEQVSDLSNASKTSEVKESAYTINKKQLNAAIIESSLKFNATASDQPQSLVLKTVLQGINEALQEIGMDISVEDAYESGIDVSPEATAERIVSFSTQLFSSYREQHPEMAVTELIRTFADTIGAGIEQGFSEAKEILGGLNVLQGDIADNIDKTYELVQLGLKSFIESAGKTEDEIE